MSLTSTRVIAVRHGNTFKKGDTLLRVGKRTDLDLVETEKGTRAGQYIKDHGYQVSHIFSGPLKRHIQSTDLINNVLNVDKTRITIDGRFNELDYGEHDGMPEADIVEAVGKDALAAWDKDATVPTAWDVDVEQIKNDWHTFLQEVSANHSGEDVLVVTSNGLLRFLPFVIDCDYSELELKVPTGGVVVIEKTEDEKWNVVEWGVKP
ncbi:histidine phosphatase family protein [Vibrio hannami]|uniref:histidine phosphatase family protein n=1 Tax=Vibrio hannami TaxID=2717094 RepID=UPI0024105C5B|nr:histidine phosphatase family protein [Vibrio hannami]MDG3084740.1 histidine phosphatase family protein [Vibrio hannami]